MVVSPFDRHPQITANPTLAHIKKRSEMHDSSIANSNKLNHALRSNTVNDSGLTNPSESDLENIISDFPAPKILFRQFLYPSTHLSSGDPLGKVTGFRIQIKGRKGSRRVKQVFSFGALNIGKLGVLEGSHVDFGRSTIFSPRQGIRSVKVWVGYSTK